MSEVHWAAWGGGQATVELPAQVVQLLTTLLGPGTPPADVALASVAATVTESRLPAHPLVSFDAIDRVRHAHGQSLPDLVALRSGRIPVVPDGVAYPETETAVREVLAYAARTGTRLIPYGGGTSVVGHVTPLPGDAPVLTVDLKRLCRLYEFDPTAALATFGAGITGPDLEAHLRARGYTLGHFPQSFEQSTLGGWVATRSSGQYALGYGRIERLFLGGRLETPVGTLELPAVPASAAGPDLREVVLGSEGRLGILTSATVRVTPLPQHEALHAVFFPEWEAGLTALRVMLQAQLPLLMLRYSSAVETELTLTLAGNSRAVAVLERLLSLRGAGASRCLLLLGVAGRERVVAAAHTEALDIARRHHGVSAGRLLGQKWRRHRFRAPYQRDALWRLGYAADTVETAVDWSRVPTLVAAIEEALRRGLTDVDERVYAYTHLSHVYPTGSNVYTTFIFRLAPDPQETLRRWQVLKAAASEAIIAHRGTISHQHGVGLDHRPYLAIEKGEVGMGIMRAIMAQLDPMGIMNPEKLLD